MLGFARNIAFFRVNGALGAEKSRLACAKVLGVVALAWKCSGIARAVELMVQGNFSFLYDAVLLSFAYVATLSVLEPLRSKDVFYSTVLLFIVFCNSVSADRSGMDASRFIVAAAACVILLRFAAESRKSH